MLLSTLLTRVRTRAGQDRHTAMAGGEWLRHVASLPADELLEELGTSRHGLAEDQVEPMRAFWGENSLAHAERPSLPRRVLAAFADPFTYILVAIAAISVLTDWVLVDGSARDLTTPAIIGVMVLVSGALRFVQTERSDDAAEALRQMIETTCSVERADEGRTELPLDELVVGDVVHLSSGDVVPADLRLISARDLFVSQSSLTGESEPVEKRPGLGTGAAGAVAPGEKNGPAVAGAVGAKANNTAGTAAGEKNAAGATATPLTDLDDLALMGSTVISGTGCGVVVATGGRTLLGEAAGSLGGRDRSRRVTAASAGVAATSRLLVGLMLAMVPTVLVVSGVTKGNWLDALLFSLSVAVGLTPEMLPMLVTCCLGKGSVDLSRDRVITKRLDAISDLGAVDVLCCDKTGTLTEDRVILERHLDVSGRQDPDVLRAAFLNSFFGTGVKNLIDSAIIRRAASADVGADELAGRWSLVDELPFDFERRRLSVVVGDERGRTLLVCKGAIEEVLSVCSGALVEGEVVPLTPELSADLLARARGLETRGMRVLGVAQGENPAGAARLTAQDERDLTLIGYLAFLDPPKPSATEAVRALAAHGVATKVLTGDSAAVAAQVCETIGIPADDVLTGADVEALDDEALTERAGRASIFAKLSPAQKARVVEALRRGGHVVGFMGDGANDASAMRASDCGISVDSAVDVAREAADVILLEKDLMVLERGIVCGRRTLANMVKYVKMTVSSNFGNILSVLVAAVALPFLPMGAVQLLLLNLVYDITCTALPWDSVDDELVAAPRRWDDASIRRFMLRMGPVSTAFDLVTFAGLYFLVCPAVAGGSWGALDAAGRALFTATFQAGWFVESMWTQTIAVHVIRTARVPLVQSRAAAPLTALGAAGIALATALPYTPVGAALDLAPLPAGFFVLLACVVVGYVAALSLAKRAYVRRYGEFL